MRMNLGAGSVRGQRRLRTDKARAAAGLLGLLLLGVPALSQQLPEGFVDQQVLAGLDEPATLAFSPDGRLFVGERITGRLLVATRSGDTWTLGATPFHVFDVPKNGDGTPARHRSSGLRDIAFDPDFVNNGWLYAFVMQNNPRHNHVVRIQASTADPSIADPSTLEQLIELPFNATGSSGSHNGGGLEFGADGQLYITTGDGWSGGDSVQSLSTWTGKVLRLAPDGSIPTDNPFEAEASGDFRAIYAMGLRNPFSISFDPASGDLFVNDAVGAAKANIYLLEAGANYGHQGGTGITPPWANAAAAGELVTGGAWMPLGGSFPAEYQGAYFLAMWGSNGSNEDGAIGRILSRSNPTAVPFATQVHDANRKPILTRVDPLTGDLFYALTTYETESGSVHRIRWTGAAAAAPPTFLPLPGSYDDPVAVTASTTTSGGVIRYRTDGVDPTEASPILPNPLQITETTMIRARTFATGLDPSAVAQADYQIGPVPNLPPVVIAGVPQIVEVGRIATLNGSATTDPDGDDDALVETWTQIDGPPLDFTGDDFVTFLEPQAVGVYTFELEVSDGIDTVTAQTTVEAVPCLDDVFDGLVGRWEFEEGNGTVALDSSVGARVGELVGTGWTTGGALGSGSAARFEDAADRIDFGTFDLGGAALTIAAWIQPASFAQMDGRIVSKATGVQDDDHFWMLSTIAQSGEHRLRARIRTGSPAVTTTLIADSGSLEIDAWQHVAMTYDGTDLRLFLDGTEVGATAVTGALVTNPLVPVAAGNQPQGDRPFDGGVDGLRIYDRALSADELLTLAGLGADTCAGLVFVDGFESGNTSAWN